MPRGIPKKWYECRNPRCLSKFDATWKLAQHVRSEHPKHKDASSNGVLTRSQVREANELFRNIKSANSPDNSEITIALSPEYKPVSINCEGDSVVVEYRKVA